MEIGNENREIGTKNIFASSNLALEMKGAGKKKKGGKGKKK